MGRAGRRIVRNVGDGADLLASVRSVLVVDWPSREVPESLARAGYDVVVSGGPEPDNYSAYKTAGRDVVVRFLGRRPDQVDLVYAHRPLDELPAIVEMATMLGAVGVWWQSGRAVDGSRDPRGCWMSLDDSTAAHRRVEAAGLRYVDDVYIADAVRDRD
jgi:predicted CoA-binding protein